MFIIKKNYYFYIDNTKSINLNSFISTKKIILIYRNNGLKETIKKLSAFKKKCKIKQIKFYIANDYKMAKKCRADGLYLSSYNMKNYRNIEVIGSAHNHKEIINKIKQGCKTVILSRLYATNYKKKKSFYGIIKYNLIAKQYNTSLIPLGGIRHSNLLRLNNLNANGFAILSELKKKPTISSRLF